MILFEMTDSNIKDFGEVQHLIVKQLPKCFSERYGFIPDIIFVRECYTRFYNATSDLMANGSRKFGVTLFMGVPGIGKSLFLIYRFISDA